MRLSPPPALLLQRRRPGLFGALGQRQRLLSCGLGQPPLQSFGNVLHVASSDPAVCDDVAKILTGNESLRTATGDQLQAPLLGNNLAESQPDSVRYLYKRADLTHELRRRGIYTLLPRRALGAEVSRLLIEVLTEKKCQEKRRRDRAPLLDKGINTGEHLAETGMGESLTFGVEPGGEKREKRRKETGLAEKLAALRRFSREQYLEHLFIESRREALTMVPAADTSALRVSSSIVKPSLAAKRTARSIRTGSS